MYNAYYTDHNSERYIIFVKKYFYYTNYTIKYFNVKISNLQIINKHFKIQFE